jgi:hypothetical protein
MDCIQMAQESVWQRDFEYGTEPTGFKNGGEFLDQLINYQLLLKLVVYYATEDMMLPLAQKERNRNDYCSKNAVDYCCLSNIITR